MAPRKETAQRAPPPSGAELQELASSTHFSAAEVSALVQRFAQLDTDGDGKVDVDVVCEMPEVAMYPLLRRIVSKFNSDKSGNVTFSEFVRAFSTLSGKATLQEKLRFAFELYDINGNGVIDAAEMFDVFRLMNPRQYTDDSLQQIVNAFMAEYSAGAYALVSALMYRRAAAPSPPPPRGRHHLRRLLADVRRVGPQQAHPQPLSRVPGKCAEGPPSG